MKTSTTFLVLDSLEQVDLFCDTIRAMKEAAPISLNLKIAVTAARDVVFKGAEPAKGRDPVLELRRLDQFFRAQRDKRKYNELG